MLEIDAARIRPGQIANKFLVWRRVLERIARDDVEEIPSLPDARPRSDRFRCCGRGSNFLQSVSRDDLILGEDAVAQGAIKEDLIRRNLAPKRYGWKNKGEEILAKILRASAAMGNQMEKSS